MNYGMIKNHIVSENTSGTRLLRLGVVLLSVVSFFTTANGMLKYIFVDNQAIAYASSAAIQGILLALSMNLPGYLKRTWEKTTVEPRERIPWFCVNEFLKKLWRNKKNRHIWSKICCVLIVLLTIVTIFTSSWFSYVFIAETLHGDSWGTDSELLVQQTYRSQLYRARDYAHAYRLYLEESVGQKILLLEQQAASLDESEVNLTGFDLDVDMETYGTGAASSYMIPVINTLRAALEENASQEAKDLAVTALIDAQTNISNQLENIRQNISRLDSNITQYTNQITALNTRITNAAEGVDTTSMVNTVNRLTQLIADTTQRQADLQGEDLVLSEALARLPTYESALGLNNSTSPVAIRSNLIQLQAEFFQQDPDEAVMLGIATDLFEDLRNAVRAGTIRSTGTSDESNQTGAYPSPEQGISAGPTTSNMPASGIESLSSTNLLLQMNRLTQNLRDYAEIKAIETNLEQQITDIRTAENDTEKDPSASAGLEETASPEGSPTPGEESALPESASPEPEGSSLPSSAPLEESTAPINSSEVNATDNPSPSDTPEPNEGTPWKELWGRRLNDLKAQIGALPSYSDNENNSDSVLLESQTAILRNYDRDGAGKELDDTIRRYISEHNAVYQGIIYLQSPYRSLAFFALMLALSFDLSGFIFGFATQNNPQEFDGASTAFTSEGDTTTAWGVPEAMNTYYILTGDYECQDGKYFYTAFKDGLRVQLEFVNIMPHGPQIAMPDREKIGNAKLCPDTDQSLCFAHQSGSEMDGIYTNCDLIFNDGSLLMRKNGLFRFIAPVEEFMPVHIYDTERGVHRTVPSKDLGEKGIHVKKAAVALSEKGTRVVAVYAIEGKSPK